MRGRFRRSSGLELGNYMCRLGLGRKELRIVLLFLAWKTGVGVIRKGSLGGQEDEFTFY